MIPFGLCVAGLGLGSCERSSGGSRPELTVLAAASLGDVIGEIAQRFEPQVGAKVVVSTGASGALYKQIGLGAPWDVYIPAAPSYVDPLEAAGRLAEGGRIPLARNQLVVVTTGSGETPWFDLSRLNDPTRGGLAIASPEHAPAGRYTEQALRKAGLWSDLRPRLVYAHDVRLAARYVADGALKVGFVYATDALAFGGRLSVVYRFGGEDHDAIVLEGAIHREAKEPDLARRFVAFAHSAGARPVWERHGFGPAESPPP